MAEQAVKKPEYSHATARSLTTQLKDIKKTLPLRVLSPADWHHWTTQGLCDCPQGRPADRMCSGSSISSGSLTRRTPNDPSTWNAPQRRDHTMKELNNSGMVEIYNHQYLWDNRQEQRVYDAFVDVWDRTDLWVVIDRANLNPPRKVEGNPNGFIHWDVDTSLDPLPIGVQGVLSLKKQDGEVGGFQCMPELFDHFDELGEDASRRTATRCIPTPSGLKIINVEMEAGDLLIFNTLLAHGVRPNRSKDRVRMAQYISM